MDRGVMAEAGKLLPEELVLHWYSRLGSTNAEALRGNWRAGTVIAADSQDNGRGRLGRQWQSPPGLNLYFSLVYRPSLPVAGWGGFSLAVGAYVGEALSAITPDLGLKWPNDLMLAHAKLGGILLETSGGKVVAGVGVNVNQRVFPPDLPAVSLALATGKSWRRDRLLVVLATAAWAGLNTWDRGDPASVFARWRALDTLLGRRVRATRGKETIAGVAVDLGPEGQLIVRDSQGVEHVLNSGEVTLRPKA